MSSDQIWVISDTHFLHNNIVKYQNRPEDHNKIMFENWNKVVGINDTVIHCGDLSAGVGKHENGYEILKQICNNLNGRKIMVRGNHDHYTEEQYNELGFEIIDNNYIHGGILFCHYPPKIDQWVKERYKPIIEEIIKTKLDKTINFVVHGHSHNTKYPDLEYCFNATVERINYTPINLNEIKRIMNERN